MKSIGIIGTRGIPNNYGGFEQFAQYLAQALSSKGYKVTVYCQAQHPFKESSWEGVELIHITDPERLIGSASQFVYDFACIVDSRRRNFDIILQLGYTSSAIFHWLLSKKSIVITNMDGLEWKRSKYSKLVKKFLKYSERLAAINSDVLIADSKGIQAHLMEKYGAASYYIPYGASLFQDPDETSLIEYGLTPFSYNLLIARMEPENNIEAIIEGHIKSSPQNKLVLIGKLDNSFAKYLINKYRDRDLIFLGGIYDLDKLNNIRFFSNLYFHGHSVGGTNPSLLEAMASNCLIVAHNNKFNQAILGSDAFYFDTPIDIGELLNSGLSKTAQDQIMQNNSAKVNSIYSWQSIIDQYETLFEKSIRNDL